MDPLQLTGIVAVSVGAGFIAGSHRYMKVIRTMQTDLFSRAMESTSRITHAAIQTMTDDFKLDELEVRNKLFKRCGEHGVQLVQIDGKTGAHVVLSNPEEPKK